MMKATKILDGRVVIVFERLATAPSAAQMAELVDR